MPDIDETYVEENEPTANQVGIDVPGARSSFTDFVNFGVYNGNFRVGPPNPAANVDPVGSSGSNFVPGWRFIQASNTVISGKTVLGSKQGSGSNFRFTHDASGTSGTVFVEQIIDIGGSAVGDIGATTRIEYQVQSGTWSLSARNQYLAGDGSIVGMPQESIATISGLTSTAAPASIDGDQSDDPAPATARYLRYRVGAESSSANGVLDLYGVRRERATMYAQLIDSSRTTNGIFNIVQRGSNLIWAPTSTTQFGSFSGTQRLLNYQLVPIPFTVNSIATSATTDMQPFDNAVNQGTARISMGWPGWIVGVSYRMTGAPTGGGATALNVWATVAGAQTWNAFTIASGGSAASQTTQAVGTTGMNFSASQGLGIQLVTNGTYAPNGTRNMSAILWVALEYDGA